MKSLPFPKENIKIIKYKILLFFVISLVLKLNVFAQYTMPNITVDWRRNDWVQQNPEILNSSASQQSFTRSQSGSDWWYDIKYSYSNGSNPYGFPNSGNAIDHFNGYILSGYSSINNFDGVDPGQSCYLKQEFPYDCNSLYKEGVGENVEGDEEMYKTQFYHTMAKLSPDGKELEWFKVLPFNSNCYRTIQLRDGSYIGVGDTYSIYDFNGMPMPYNKNEIGSNGINNFCNNATSITPPLNMGWENGQFKPEEENKRMWRLFGVTKISASGEILWTNLYGYESYSQLQAISTVNLGCIPNGMNGLTGNDQFDLNCKEKNKFDNEAWDVVQSLQSNDIFVGGRRDKFGSNEAIILRINSDNGNLIAKGIVPVEPLLNYGYPTYSTVKALSINIRPDGQEEVIAGIVSGFFYGNNSDNARITLTSVRSDCLSCVTNWSHRIPQAFTSTKTQQNINSITKIKGTEYFAAGVLLNCSDCTSSGKNNGYINAIKFNSDGIVNQTNLGLGGAFDFRVGVCNNVFSNDGSISLTSAKKSYHKIRTSGFTCPIDPSVTISGYEDFYDTDTYFAKFDSDFNLLWDATVPNIDDNLEPRPFPGDWRQQECMYSIVEAPDKGLISAGNESYNLDDNYLVKVNSPCADYSNFDIVGQRVHVGWSSTPVETENEYWIGNYNNNVVWDSSKKIYGTVVIHSGGRLKITGQETVIQFSDNYNSTQDASKIIVMPGGILELEDGAKITSMLSCPGNMWGGVEIWGNNNQGQFGLIGSPAPQGFMSISGGATIENAICGIRIGSGKELELYENGFNYNMTKGGGILYADNSNFLNNNNDIDFCPYGNPNNNLFANRSYINKCSFLSNKILNRRADGVAYMYCSDDDGDNQLEDIKITKTHINLSNVSGIRITGCSFKNDLPLNANGEIPVFSKGINSFGSGFTLTNSEDDNTQNTFENLLYAVKAGAYHASVGCLPSTVVTQSPLININNCIFTNCLRGVELDGTMLSKVNRNTFEINSQLYHSPIDNQTPIPVAIFTNAALGFEISDNDIYNTFEYQLPYYGTFGIANNNSIAGSGKVYKNKVNNQFIKQTFFGNNSAIRANCNEYNTSNFGTIDWLVQNNLADQGQCNLDPFNPDPTKPQTNLFSSTTINPNFANFQIAMAFSNTSPFKYSTYTELSPTEVSAGVDVEPCQNELFDPNSACPSIDYSVERFAHLPQKYLDAKNHLQFLISKIDDAKTSVILNNISNGSYVEIAQINPQSKNLLSDPVLCRMLYELPSNNWNRFLEIMLDNSPLSPRVISLLDSAQMPNAVAEAIAQAQTGTSAMQELQSKIKQAQFESDNLLGELLIANIDSANTSGVYSILNQDKGVYANLLGMFFFTGLQYQEFSRNLQKQIDSLFLFNRNDKNILDYSAIKNMLQLQVFFNDAEGIPRINQKMYHDIKGNNNLPGTFAAVVLEAAGKEEYFFNPPSFNSNNAYRTAGNTQSQEEIKKDIAKTSSITENFKIYPNPTNSAITIELENFDKNTSYELVEITGKLLETGKFNSALNTINL